MNRPYKIPRRRKFKVMTGIIWEPFGGSECIQFAEVMAASGEDALSQLDNVVTWYGETIVREIT